MEKYFIHLKGTGQKNGVVLIDKKFEIDYNEIGKYTSSSTRKEYIQKALDFYYPELKSHNITFANVITEKVKPQKKNNGLGEFVAGAVTGYTAANVNKKKPKQASNNQINEYSFVNNISNLSQISFQSNNENDIKSNLDKIYNGIIDYKWKSTGQNEKDNMIIKENNRTLNMVLRNYSIGLQQLKKTSQNPEEIKFYEKQFAKLKRKRFFNKYGIIVFAIIALCAIMLTLMVLE